MLTEVSRHQMLPKHQCFPARRRQDAVSRADRCIRVRPPACVPTTFFDSLERPMFKSMLRNREGVHKASAQILLDKAAHVAHVQELQLENVAWQGDLGQRRARGSLFLKDDLVATPPLQPRYQFGELRGRGSPQAAKRRSIREDDPRRAFAALADAQGLSLPSAHLGSRDSAALPCYRETGLVGVAVGLDPCPCFLSSAVGEVSS